MRGMCYNLMLCGLKLRVLGRREEERFENKNKNRDFYFILGLVV